MNGAQALFKALTDAGRGQIARRHQLCQMRRIAAAQLDLALATHIPDLYVLLQVPVVVGEAAPESLGQNGVVDHRVTADAERLDARRIGRGPLAAGNLQRRGHPAYPDHQVE